MLCRTYPFSPTKEGFQSLNSRACPYHWVPGVHERAQYEKHLSEYKKEVDEYKELAKVWNHNGGGTLSEFIKFALSSLKR